MKRMLLSLCALSFCVYTYAQELPKIIPPSPNAAAFHVYGNTQVNNYTGSANISIPLWTVTEGDLSVPIYLKYTGGNGIKVEEIASWVGLGWTLNTGGAVSRIKRGKVDEDPNYGYLNINNLPSLDINSNGIYIDSQNLAETVKGNRDSEPDLFMYNFPSGSGQFFIKHNEEIFFKPQNDLKLTFSNSSSTEVVGQTACVPTNGKLGKFTITDDLGYMYEFDERERSNSLTLGAAISDNRAFPSSWLITKMSSPKTMKTIDFTYKGFPYEVTRLSANMTTTGISQMENEMYTRTYYIGKRIKTISFSQGTITFITSTNTRKDIEGEDRSLKEVLVKDINGKLLKRVVLSYAYMTPGGVVDENLVTTYSNTNRLMLNSVTEYNGDGIAKPAHKFTYNTAYSLPARDSKSKDHWGYYNGKLNTKHLPKHYMEMYDRSANAGEWKNKVYGSADRSVSINHEQVGVLTEIEYPTGGKSVFSYESHTAVSDDLAGEISSTSIGMGFPNTVQVIDVSLSSNAISKSKVKIRNHYNDNSVNKCYPVYHIKNNSENTTTIYPYNPYDTNGNLIAFPNTVSFPDIFLEDGTYNVWYTLQSDFTNNCTSQDIAPTIFSWENESTSPNKLVGGIRIKTIKNITEEKEVVKNYNYEISAGVSSGVVVSTPKYSFLKLKPYLISGSSAPDELGSYELQPDGVVQHNIPSLYPLVNTQGSTVGYEKVTVSYKDFANGKTEYYYTTANEFPDTYEGKGMKYNLKLVNGSYIYYAAGFEYASNINFLGRSIDLYPIVTADSKDFIRGLLKKEIRYKNNGNGFNLVSEQEHFYDNLYLSRSYTGPNPGAIDDFIAQPDNFLEGISTITVGELIQDPFTGATTSGSSMIFTYYDIYTGYTAPLKTISKNYFSTGTVTSTTTNKYLRDPIYNVFIDSFNPTEKEMTNSSGVTLKTESIYASDSTLINQYRIGEIVASKSFKGNTLLSHQKTIYANFGNLYLPQKIQTSKGASALEDRIVFHGYYSNGNVKEVSKKDGTHIVYIWGYNETQPIAKLENVLFSNISTPLYDAVITASDTDANNPTTTSEQTLRSALASLRASLPSAAMMTSFTYDPLIGVTSVTDPRGRVVYYKYDAFNRLETVKDHDGNILSKNQYNYKN